MPTWDGNMKHWVDLLRTSHLSSSASAFQKIFAKMTSNQIVGLKTCFEEAIGGHLQTQEFVSAANTFRILYESVDTTGHISHRALTEKLNHYIDLCNRTTGDNDPELSKLRCLLTLFFAIDQTHTGSITWSDFSSFMMSQTADALTSVTDLQTLTTYSPKLHHVSLLSTKISDPIHSVFYSPEAESFMACCKDLNIHLISPAGAKLGILRGHTALPVACASFRPYVPELSGADFAGLFPNTFSTTHGSRGGFNYISSGTDRKIILWNGLTNRSTAVIPVKSVHTCLATIDELYYRRNLLTPGIFSGDDNGMLHFWRMPEQSVTNTVSNTSRGFADSSGHPSSNAPTTHSHDLQHGDLSKIDVISRSHTISQSILNAGVHYASRVLKEGEENIALFLNDSHTPFVDGYDTSFYLENSDSWRQDNDGMDEDTTQYDPDLEKLFDETFRRDRGKGDYIGANRHARGLFFEEGLDYNNDTGRASLQHRKADNRLRQKYAQLSIAAASTQTLSPTPVWSIKGHSDWLTTILLETLLSNNSTLLATGGADGCVCLYDINQGSVSFQLRHHREAVTGLAWLHNRGLLVSSSTDRSLCLWSLSGSCKTPISVFPSNDFPYIGVFAHRNKNEFVTVDSSSKVRIYDIRKMEPVQTIVGNIGRAGKTVSAAYVNTTGYIAIATRNLSMCVPVNEGAKERLSLAPISTMRVSSSSGLVLLVCDGALQFWDLLSGKLLHGIKTIFDQELPITKDSHIHLSGLPSLVADSPNETKGRPAQIKRVECHNNAYLSVKSSSQNILGSIDGRLDNSDQYGMCGQARGTDRMSVFNSDNNGEIALTSVSLEEIQELHKVDDYHKKHANQAESGSISVGAECSALALSLDDSLFAIALSDGRVQIYRRSSCSLLSEVRHSKMYLDAARSRGSLLNSSDATSRDASMPTGVNNVSDWHKSSSTAAINLPPLPSRLSQTHGPASSAELVRDRNFRTSTDEVLQNASDCETATSLYFAERAVDMMIQHTSSAFVSDKKSENLLDAVSSFSPSSDANKPSRSHGTESHLQLPHQHNEMPGTAAQATKPQKSEVSSLNEGSSGTGGTFSELVLFVLFKMSAQIITYRIVNTDAQQLARTRLKMQWTDTLFLSEHNILVPYFQNEFCYVTPECSTLCRASFTASDCVGNLGYQGKSSLTPVPIDPRCNDRLEIRFMLNVGSDMILAILVCGLICCIHARTGSVFGTVDVRDMCYISYAASMTETKTLALFDEFGTLRVLDISRAVELCEKFSQFYVLSYPLGANAVDYHCPLTNPSHFYVMNFDTQKAYCEPYAKSMWSESFTISSSAKSLKLVRFSAQFTVRRQFFTLPEVPRRFRGLFPTISPTTWALVDAFNQTLMNSIDDASSDKDRDARPQVCLSNGTPQLDLASVRIAALPLESLARTSRTTPVYRELPVDETTYAWLNNYPVPIRADVLVTTTTVPFCMEQSAAESADIQSASYPDSRLSFSVNTALGHFGVLDIKTSPPLGLYFLPTVSGYVLVFCGLTGQWLCSLSHNGWPRNIRKLMRYRLKNMDPSYTHCLLASRYSVLADRSLYVQAKIASDVRDQLSVDQEHNDIIALSANALHSDDESAAASTIADSCIEESRIPGKPHCNEVRFSADVANDAPNNGIDHHGPEPSDPTHAPLSSTFRFRQTKSGQAGNNSLRSTLDVATPLPTDRPLVTAPEPTDLSSAEKTRMAEFIDDVACLATKEVDNSMYKMNSSIKQLVHNSSDLKQTIMTGLERLQAIQADVQGYLQTKIGACVHINTRPLCSPKQRATSLYSLAVSPQRVNSAVKRLHSRSVMECTFPDVDMEKQDSSAPRVSHRNSGSENNQDIDLSVTALAGSSQRIQRFSRPSRGIGRVTYPTTMQSPSRPAEGSPQQQLPWSTAVRSKTDHSLPVLSSRTNGVKLSSQRIKRLTANTVPETTASAPLADSVKGTSNDIINMFPDDISAYYQYKRRQGVGSYISWQPVNSGTRNLDLHPE